MITPQKIMFRFYFIVIGLFLFSMFLVAKLSYIVLIDGDKYTALSDSQMIKNVVIQPSRGNIYAADGNILATSIPSYELRWDAVVPRKAVFEKYKQALADELSKLSGRSSRHELQKLENARLRKNRYMLVARNINFSTYKKIKSFPLFNLSSYKGGLIVEQQIKRENPLGKVAERTIGYEIQDPDGTFLRVGLEGAYSKYLRGEEGVRLKQKIANGQWKPINDNNEKEPTEGFDVYTTIDVNIQNVAHTALLAQLERFDADHGSVVVMEVETGEVKAIVNLGKTSKNTYFEKLNYAVGESNEPGSTFKLMSMIAALEDGVINENSIVATGKGVLKFYEKYSIVDSKVGGFGTLTAAKAFEVSSNVGVVKLIHRNYKNQPEKFVDRLYNMGLDKALGLSIIGEPAPKIPYPSDHDWDGLDLPWMAFGYGVSLTPMQTLTFYNAVANNGEMVKPKFVKEISNLGDTPKKIFYKEVLNPSICSEATLKKVKRMLYNVVDKKWGTAHRIKDKNLKMSGKTGTCQLDYTTDNIQYISSFVGYFPSDAPKYSCIVVIHRPNKSKGYYGATVAAPVFGKIAKNIFNNIPKKIDFQSNLVNTIQAMESKVIKRNGRVPNLIGYSVRDAVVILEKLGLNVAVKGSGRVKKQSIKPGVPIIKGQAIILVLS